MEIRLNFYTFVRKFDESVFVYNSKNAEELIVDKSGGIFLSSLSRDWKSLPSIVSDLYAMFIDVDRDELAQDAANFFNYLGIKGFLDFKDNDRVFLSSKMPTAETETSLNPLVKEIPDTTQLNLLKMFSQNPKLFSLQVELTNLCNERCIHCYIPHKFKTRWMSMANYEQILKQAKELGVLTFVINGGEPLCHPQFLEMLKEAENYDLNIKILSNLTLLTDEIVGHLRKSHVSEIQTSIYSLDSTVHDGITCMPGSLNLTLKNILKLKKNGIPVRISCVLMKQNKESYKSLVLWAKEHQIPISVDYIMFARYDFSTDNLDNRLDKTDIEQIIRDTIASDEAYIRKIRNTDFKLLDEYFRQIGLTCNVGRSTLCFASDGTAYPCIGWQSYKLGNIEDMTISQIWNGVKLQQLRKISRNDFEECKDCKDKIFCSRCLVRNANENNGDFMKLSRHTCDIAGMNRTLCREILNIDYIPS